MYLKSLELNGFKSFAKKSSLEFGAPITAIVGPNGSGKSNCAEAFRFVLGEQSIKSMRGKKTEDLIWNGGGTAGRSNRASVKIIFDNSRRYLNIDFDEVTIERAIYRDSLSEYSINGSQVRLKDIIELLSGAHIGASGHHIISQGEADKILNANLKERREMIEDALGLKIYQYKRLESERKLLKTEENIKSVESLRREIAPHLKFLKKQVEKVEKAREMKNTLSSLYRDYLKREETYIKFHKKAIEEDLKSPTVEMENLVKALAEAKGVLSRGKGSDGKSAEVVEVENKLEGARTERYEILRSIGRLEGEIGSAERILAKQKELIAKEADAKISLREVEELEREVESRLKEAEEAGDFGLAKSIFIKIREIFRNFISKNKSSGGDGILAETEAEIGRLKNEKKSFEEKLSAVKDKEDEFNKGYLKLREEIEKEKDKSRDAEKEVFRIMGRQNEVRAKIEMLKAKEENLRRTEEDFKMEIREGMVLVGRDIALYENFSVLDGSGGAFSEAEIANEDRHLQEERRRAVEKIKIRLEDAGAGGGEEIMKEFNEVSERDAFLERELGDLFRSAESLKNLIKDLEERLNAEFRSGIEKINKQFQEFFLLMFGGGTARLAVVKEEKKKRGEGFSGEDFEGGGGNGTEPAIALEDESFGEAKEGIDIEVNLPRKKIKGLMMLSGGERALASIALIFAVSQVNPPPFIILDETDAALDEANSKKYGDMIENLAKYSQLILITHNRETMSRAGVIYGVTMGSDGASKLLSIEFGEAVAVAK